MLANRDLKSLDTEKPMILLDGEAQTECKVGEVYTVPAAKAADNSTSVTLKVEVLSEDGQLVYVVGGDGAEVNTFTLVPEEAGVYTLVYTALDGAGNTETLKIVGTVSENETPDTETPDTKKPNVQNSVKPVQSLKPSGSNGSINSAKTGDETNLLIPMIAIMLSLGVIVSTGVLIYKRRRMSK